MEGLWAATESTEDQGYNYNEVIVPAVTAESAWLPRLKHLWFKSQLPAMTWYTEPNSRGKMSYLLRSERPLGFTIAEKESSLSELAGKLGASDMSLVIDAVFSINRVLVFLVKFTISFFW